MDYLLTTGSNVYPSRRIGPVNPAWRRQDQQVRRGKTALVREQAEFGVLQLPGQSDPQVASDIEQRKGQRLERIESNKRPWMK